MGLKRCAFTFLSVLPVAHMFLVAEPVAKLSQLPTLLAAKPHSDDMMEQEMNHRRDALGHISASLLSLTCPWIWQSTSTSVAAAVEAQSSSTSLQYIPASEAKITQRVAFDVRISRQDGSFFVRDDLPDTPENQVFYGRLVIGLFGENAPVHVEKFLSFIRSPAALVDEDNPMPSYSRSQFTRLDQATGLVTAGKIPSLQVTELGGSAALQYYGRLVPASMWIEKNNALPRIRHAEKGLLTHAALDVTPEFGITTRRDSGVLDGRYTVFGQILLDESSEAFLSRIEDIPTYGMERPTSKDGVVEDAAAVVFNAQRQFFRNTAKSFGDSRLDKVYEGKLLRRIEVTKVEVL